MPRIRLLREVTGLGACGPVNGQYALQKALRARLPDWLAIGGRLGDGEIPWIWSWEDRHVAVACAQLGQPFIVGPNVLFADSRRPCQTPSEQVICRATSCRLMFTESAWYRDLIELHRGRRNRAPIVVWPYPIDPTPRGPKPAQYDLLIYAKSGYDEPLIRLLRRRFPRTYVLHYRRFTRPLLWSVARHSRCCLYLSDDDRGPLALAEILLSGCPAIGLPTGAPFIRHGTTGVTITDFTPQTCIDAVTRCHGFDRRHVSTLATEQFDTKRIVDTILTTLAKSSHQIPNLKSQI
ncbi:MAG: hypothetical protein HQ567_32500 [Candidatus Nealsonbacteria bacterium]|nr:hypothetical protein [Candidatus Nealsonbacteria bacterium]